MHLTRYFGREGTLRQNSDCYHNHVELDIIA